MLAFEWFHDTRTHARASAGGKAPSPAGPTRPQTGRSAALRRPSGDAQESQRSRQPAAAAKPETGGPCPGGSLDACIGKEAGRGLV